MTIGSGGCSKGLSLCDLKNEENLRLILVFGSPLPSSNNRPSTRSSQEATEPSSPSLTLFNHNYLTLPYNIPEILCLLRKVSCWQFEMVAVDNAVVQALEIDLVDQEQIFATLPKYSLKLCEIKSKKFSSKTALWKY
ncbi:hypothetical protein GQX74_015462 [Glossina fuscipes]|nr:hypothetical protein GQX74_015462 [Glossina fuscipes]